METRQLGKVGPEVSAIGLGCMPMSGTYGAAEDEVSITTIHRAIEIGITLIDTADVYGDGHNEELVGKALKGRRDEVILATKFGHVHQPDGSVSINGRPEYVRTACERSLKRLGIDHIDLYQQHRVDPDTPIEETIGALSELVDQGKIRFIGLSEALAPDLRRAAAIHPITSLQSEYSLLERSVENNEVLDTCEELGIGFLPFSPLMRGLLAGSLTDNTQLEEGDFRAGDRFPKVGPEHRARNFKLVQVVYEIASEHDAAPGQVALSWLLAQKPWIVPIPGTKRAKYVEQNAESPDLKLTDGDMERLNTIYAEVSGARYGGGGRTPDWVSPPQGA